MKEELESTIILEGVQSQSQCHSLFPIQTQAGSFFDRTPCVRVSENSGSINKSEGSVTNGFIVYSRVKKNRHSCNGFSDNCKVKRLRVTEGLVEDAELAVTYSGGGVQVDNLRNKIEVEVNSNVKSFKCNELRGEPDQSLSGDGGVQEVPVVVSNNNEMKKDDVDKKISRRFTRSALKIKVESRDQMETAAEAVQNANAEPDEKVNAAAVSGLTSPSNKLELKMSKKIVLSKKPMTVKELFDTGFLEGVPVVYMGGVKFSGGLRGVIQDGGILCSCSLCNGRRIIPPSKFEIHATKQYRRAAQYICLENGKSLLDLMRACRAAPLHTLEATLQIFICSAPEEKYFTCKRCKGCFPSSSVPRMGLICHSCIESKDFGESSVDVVGKRIRPPKSVSVSKPSSNSGLCIPSEIKSHRKTRIKPSKWVSSSKSSISASLPILSKKRSMWKKKQRSSKVSVKLKSPRMSSSSKCLPMTSSSKCLSSPNKSQWRVTKKDQRLHRLVFEEDGLPDGTEVAYYGRGQKLLEGYKKGFGILCQCCNTLVSPSQFEVHAGWSSRKKPYAYIYTSNGVSLHELAISLSKGRKYLAKDNDDLCIICGDGGNLLLCDGCPRAFHKECASLTSIPQGDWYCKFCQNMFEREKFVAHNANAFAAGRVEGVDPIKEITQRCIRIVKDIDADLSGCVLCRGCDFSRSGFGPRTIILCDQCEKEYHVGCLRDYKMSYLKELPEGDWFCCLDCTRIHSTLLNLLVRGAEKLPDTLLDVLKKKQEDKGLEFVDGIDVRWQLLNGKIASPETRPLLSEAVAIFHECFDPIVDATNGRDLIPAMVYGRNLKGQEFVGMYCAILMINSSVVSAGMLRIFGTDVAELPLVATSNSNHGKGYFQILFSCIERLLAFLNVKNLVLPAAEEAVSIWTEKFGFKKMKPEELSNYRKECRQMVTFKGTSMLQKTVPACRIVNSQSIKVEQH